MRLQMLRQHNNDRDGDKRQDPRLQNRGRGFRRENAGCAIFFIRESNVMNAVSWNLSSATMSPTMKIHPFLLPIGRT